MERYTETQTLRILSRQIGPHGAATVMGDAKRSGAVIIGGLRVGFATGKGYGPEGSYSIS